MPKKLTYSRIAKTAGVSVMSVSNVLRTPNQVRPETKMKVHRAIRDLGGQLPEEAFNRERPTITHRPHRRIRFLTANISAPIRETVVYSRLFQSAIAAADEAGFDLSFSNLDKAVPLDQRRYSESVDGLLLMGDWSSIVKVPQVPVITLMSTKRHFRSHHIGYRRLSVGELAAEVFVERKFKRVAYIGPDDADRHEGFQQKLESNGIECQRILVPGPYQLQGGQQTVDTKRISQAVEVLVKEGLPEGVFLHSDEIAVSFRTSLLQIIPSSVQPPLLIGCNNDAPFAPLIGSGNLTIDIGVQEIARLAVARIREITKDPLLPLQRTEVEPRLIQL